MKHPLKTDFAHIELRNPIMIGSSGLTNSVEKIINLEKAGAGAVVLPSLFEEQISLEAQWMTENSDFPEAKTYIKKYIELNNVEEYLNLIRNAKKYCSIPIIASINCYNPPSWIKYAKEIESAGADAIEINVLSIDTDTENPVKVEEKYTGIIKNLKSGVSIPLIIKLSKYIYNIVYLIKRLNETHTDGIVLFNKLYQPDIDISSLKIISGSIFSKPSDLYDTLRWTGIVSGKLPDTDLVASNGVHEGGDAVKCLLAGAKAVEICSSVYQQGYDVIPQILTFMENWMSAKKFFGIEDFRGLLSNKNTSSVSIFERAQFLKYFSKK